MVRRELRVNALVCFAVAAAIHVEGVEASVRLGELLLDDVRLNRDAEVVGLAREVCGEVVILVLSSL